MPTAQLIPGKIGDRDYRPRLKVGERGQLGVRNFLVDTDDETEAVLADGLPVFGEPWDTVRVGGCVAREIGPAEILGGGVTAGRTGWSVVPVQYTSSGYGGQTPLPRDESDKWTEVSHSSRGVQVYYGVQETPGWEEAINNGSGVAIEGGAAEFIIRFHRPPTANINPIIAKLLALTSPVCKVNDDTVNLPPIYRSSNYLTFAKGQLLFKGYGIALVNGLVQISCVLAAAEDHKARWTKINDKGEAVAVFFTEVYEEAAFGGIW